MDSETTALEEGREVAQAGGGIAFPWPEINFESA